MAKAPPSTDFFWNDFISGTAHMTPGEVGCYLRLLAYQWSNGAIPRCPKRLSRICICSREEFDSHWPAIAEKFVTADESGDSLVNERMAEDRAMAIDKWSYNKDKNRKLTATEISDKRSEAGRRGAQKRWQNDGKSDGKTLLKPQENMANDGKTMAKHGKREGGRRKDIGFATGQAQTAPPDGEPTASARDCGNPQPDEVIRLWNTTKGVTPCRGLMFSGKRMELFQFALAHPSWLDDFKEALDKFPLKCSDRPGGWKPGIDWILDHGNLIKVLEGQYDWSAADEKPKEPNLEDDPFFADCREESA